MPDRLIRITTALVVVGVATVAAIISYEHAYELARAHGNGGWTARLVPLTVDGLIYSSSMVILQSARRGVRVPALALWLLALGIMATLAASILHGLGHGPTGAAVAAWPAVALVGSYEISPGVLSPSHDVAPEAWRRRFATCLSHCGARYRRCSEARPVKTCHMCNSSAEG